MKILQKKFCKKLECHTNGKIKFNIIWSTKKPKALLKIKDNVKRLSCVIYQGICSWRNKSVGEIMRKATTKAHKHEQPNSKSEPPKTLEEQPKT